ncbi:hypothetical protein [Gemmatimonas sp.]|uniref:hypothetical protein n=1 Tax=Gemmatimonas sp. TaxID=1962908 RepID=UPI0031C46A8A|nr:hypothetical protein [Gemmatimonas sp.]
MTPPSGAAPRRSGSTSLRHGSPFRSGSRAASVYQVLEAECERLGRTITKREWWLAVDATPTERPLHLNHFYGVVKLLVARRLVVGTAVPGTVTTYRPLGSVVAHAGLVEDPTIQALLEVVRRLSSERGRAVSTREINAAMRTAGVVMNGNVTTPRLTALADVTGRVHAPRVRCVPVFAPGRLTPTYYWQPWDTALPTPEIPLDPSSVVRVAVWHAEVVLGRPVKLEEVRRWAQVHDTDVARAFRALRRTKQYFEHFAMHGAVRAPGRRSSEQSEALRTPWTCAGGAAQHYSAISLGTGLTSTAVAEGSATAEPIDVGIPESCERLGAVYASALAVAVDAHRTWQDLAHKATRPTPAGAGDHRALLLQATAILQLFDDGERHMRERGALFASGHDAHRHDLAHTATFEGAVARAHSAMAIYRQWVEHAKETGRNVETKRFELRWQHDALAALVPLRTLCQRLVADAPSSDARLVRLQTVGAHSGVVVRAALPALVAARRLLGETGTTLERRAYHALDTVRRVPGMTPKTGTTTRAFYAAGALDRVDAVRTAFGQLPLPRAAAILASAAAWLGPVVRDIAVVRDQLDRTPGGHASHRRAAVVALGLLGDPEVATHPAIRLDDPLDVAAAALALVCASVMPPMGIDAWTYDHSGRHAIRHEAMLDAIRGLETRISESTTGERAAALHVAGVAVQRIRTERWFEVVD